MRTCKVCGAEKSESEYFTGSKDGKSWIYGKCKSCCMEAQRKYRTEGCVPAVINRIPDRKICKVCGIDKLGTEYRVSKRGEKAWAANTCKTCESDREKLLRKQDPTRSYRHHASRRKDPVAHRAKQRSIYKSEAIKRRQYGREWYEANAERVRSQKNKWRKDHPSVNVTFAHNYRAKLRGNGGRHTCAEWQAICEKYEYKCLCCGKEKFLTRDHILPVIMGGSNSIDNIQPLCKSCNPKKKDKHIDYRPEAEYRGIELSVRLPASNTSRE